jgi:hypothetical protein
MVEINPKSGYQPFGYIGSQQEEKLAAPNQLVRQDSRFP